jgi:hypothetical protein
LKHKKIDLKTNSNALQFQKTKRYHQPTELRMVSTTSETFNFFSLKKFPAIHIYPDHQTNIDVKKTKEMITKVLQDYQQNRCQADALHITIENNTKNKLNYFEQHRKNKNNITTMKHLNDKNNITTMKHLNDKTTCTIDAQNHLLYWVDNNDKITKQNLKTNK